MYDHFILDYLYNVNHFLPLQSVVKYTLGLSVVLTSTPSGGNDIFQTQTLYKVGISLILNATISTFPEISRMDNWFLPQIKFFNAALFETSKVDNWFSWQYKYIKAELFERSKLVNGLTLQRKSTKAGLLEISKLVNLEP